MVADGDFREDLFYRLYVVVITLPPLRERSGDVALLLTHFLAEFNAENGRSIEGFSSEAMELLMAYRWPGNVRELRNAVEQMVVLARSARIGVRDVPAHIREANDAGVTVSVGSGTLEDLEKQAIAQALKACGGNRTRAAEQLGISRRTLHRKISEYGFEEVK